MLSITTLGKFLVEDDITGARLDDDALRSDMLKKLTAYLISHREHSVSVQELADALWHEDETENPTGALKNLMYRLRTVLKKHFGDADYVLTCPGAYRWNPDIEIKIDSEEFEALIKEAKLASEANAKIAAYEKAVDLYQGDFLENSGDRHWIVTTTTYYHSMYLNAVKRLSALYAKQERFADIEKICTFALRFDSVDEQIYCDLIRSLIKQQKNDLAIKNFDNAKKILYEQLGISRPKRLAEVQKELLVMDKGSVVEKMQDIHEDMREDSDLEGVFFCGYPVFKEIYRLEARKIQRLGEAEYVLLLTVTLADDVDQSNPQMNKFLTNQAMNQLEKALKRTLRIGDVAAKYSDTQYIILLPTCTHESTLAVAHRIVTAFKAINKGKKIIIQTEMEQVTDAASALMKK